MSISLQQLIDQRHITPRVMALLQQQAVRQLIDMRNEGETGHINAASLVFSDDLKQLTIYPTDSTYATEREIVVAYGEALMDAIIASPNHPKRLIAIAQQCIKGGIEDLDDLDLRLEKRLSNTIYVPLIVIILILLIVLYALNAHL